MAIRKLFDRGSLLGIRSCALIILSLVLIIANYRFHYFTKVNYVLSGVVAPVQYAVTGPVEFIDWIGNHFIRQHKLLKENDKLHKKVLMLQSEEQKMIALERENANLRILLSSSAKVKGKVLVAQLLAVNADLFDQQIVLDKGEKDNIYLGQPVLDAYGVMGQIIRVGPLTSRALLITSTRSAIPVQDNRNGIRAIAVGAGYFGDLRLIYVTGTTDIKVGDVFVTSGLGLRFAEGYPVGVVKSIEHPQQAQFATIIITPYAQLNQSREVLLIWPQIKNEEK